MRSSPQLSPPRGGGIAAQRPWIVRGALCVLLLVLPACSGYQMQGKVIEGPSSSVLVVDAQDPRLQQPGVGGVSVHSVLDPREMGQKRLPGITTAGDGEFRIPVEELGAGLLEYSVQVVARKGGYQSAADIFPLPGGKKRVLVTLSRGRDTYQAQPGEVLEETLRMGQPYMGE